MEQCGLDARVSNDSELLFLLSMFEIEVIWFELSCWNQNYTRHRIFRERIERNGV